MVIGEAQPANVIELLLKRLPIARNASGSDQVSSSQGDHRGSPRNVWKGAWLLVIAFATSLAACGLSPDMHAEAQQELAQELRVEADDYSALFPQDYYYETLPQGASITEVHAALRGYEKVLRCPSGAEVYYYFSTRDNTAVRFKVFYDDTFEHFTGLVAEDWNERGIDVQDCVAGRFGE